MQILVVGQDNGAEVRAGFGETGKHWERGRYWSIETYYLYTLMWDPFILQRTRSAPVLHDALDTAAMNGVAAQTMVALARSAAATDCPMIADILQRGGCVMLQQPAVELLEEIGGPTVADINRPCLHSLRERWDLGALSSRAYYYPDQLPFLRLTPSDGAKVLSRIGGNPDLIVSNRTAMWAGNAFRAAASYTTMPGVVSQLLGDLAGLIAQTVGIFTDQPLTRDESKRLTETLELRRDFHALGFAHLTVRELARCLDREHLDLRDVDSLALDAADALVAGKIDTAQQQLTRAFQSLERVNRTLQPKPAIFTDTLHGGELYPDIGYFEIDWPQHPADTLQTYLRWAKTRSYRFNVDFGATTVREMALRFPDLFAELKLAQEQQVVEFVNGSCNQPYPPLHSLESQIRSFDIGRKVWQDVFGTAPRTYASQEYGFCPQIGAVLKQQGYEQAVIRVQNMGDAPTLRDEQIDWIAPSGDRLRALPSHPHKSEQLNLFTYNNLHVKLCLHQRESPDFAVFTCLGDITYHRPMREDMLRVCHYAPVFGRFMTFAEYFEIARNRSAPEHRLAMKDFNCDAAFLNLELWSIYTESTGNYNTNCMRSLAATNLFAAAEFLDGVSASDDKQPAARVDHDAHWEALTLYQGHGTYIVPRYPSGAFLGGIDSPRSRDRGRGVPMVAEYLGPFSPQLVKDVTEPMMKSAEQLATELIQQRLQEFASDIHHASGFMLYSFAPARRKVVRLTGAAGKPLHIGGEALLMQDFEQDRLALVDLPSYGYAFVETGVGAIVPPAVTDSVFVGDDFLENQHVRAEFDLMTGMLRQLTCKRSGRALVASDSHGFYCPDSEPQRCVGVRRVAAGPLRGAIEFDIEIPVKNQKPCFLRTRAWLDIEQEIVEFETHVVAVPELKGNQWRNHLGVRFALPNAASHIHTSHFNVLEPHDGEQLFSPNVLLAQDDRASTVFLNEGNEFYLRQNDAISNILVVQHEEARRFRYAIGRGARNPLMQARAWLQPVIAVPVHASHELDALRGKVTPSESSVSFVSFDSPDVELLSCRYEEGMFRLRVANTSDQTIHTHLKMLVPIASALMTSLAGDNSIEQPVKDGRITVSLRPWDIQQLQIQFQTRDIASVQRPTVETDTAASSHRSSRSNKHSRSTSS